MAVVGIFGGRFDPPHVGHLALARAAVRQLGLDELRVTVVADAGHKPAVAPAADRLAMARLAFPDARVELEEHAYTVDALQAYGYDDPYFVVGADQLADLPTWKEPERVLELARLAVAARPGFAAPNGSERIVVFELEPQDVSSTEIRERLRSGDPIEGLVVPEVAAYIASRGLYVR